MQPRELASQIQTEAVAGYIFRGCSAVKALKDVLPGGTGNSLSRIANDDDGKLTILTAVDANFSSGTIVLPGIFEKILQDERDIALFPRDV